MVTEGVLAETGYHGYFTVLQRNSLMPGQAAASAGLFDFDNWHCPLGYPGR